MIRTKTYENRTAVVTGAAGGIGLGLARGLAARGANVVLSDIGADRLARSADTVAAIGGGVAVFECDVRDPDAVEALAGYSFDAFGGVHLICNNAGVAVFGPLVDQSLQQWRLTMDVDFWGVVHGIRAFVPRMIDAGDGGHILNTASMAGLVGMDGLALYSAAKFAVVGLSEALAREMKPHGIGVSVLAPMIVETALVSNTEAILSGEIPADGDGVEADELASKGLTGPVIGVDELVELALAGVDAGRFFILSHAEQGPILRRRSERLADAAAVVSASTT